MTNWLFLGLMLSMWTLPGAAAELRQDETASAKAQHGKPTAVLIVRASGAGATLDSDLMKGGGTDDTAVLQDVLNRAADDTPVHLLVDGVALVGGLEIYGNTTLECVRGGGLYLKDGSSRAVLRNAHRSRAAIVDERITVRGCFLNGNRDRQPGAKPWPGRPGQFNNQEADGTFIAGLQFFGVNDLTIEDVTLWSIRAFSGWIANANRIDIRNVTIDHGASGDVGLDYANVDGLHFNGPVRYLTIDGLKIRSVDDGLALTANDHTKDDLTLKNDSGPYVGQGPITDVAISNVVLMDAVQGLKFLSSTEPIDRVVVSNVTGTLKGNWLAYIGNFMNPKSFGKIGSITFSNVNVDRSLPDAALTAELAEFVNSLRDNKILYDDFNEGVFPMFNINARVDNLIVKGFSTRVADRRPLIRLGANAVIRSMTVEMNLQDPKLIGAPIELDAGSHIGRLNLSVDWQGERPDHGKNPILLNGGTIDQLNWMNTPPMFVDAALVNASAVAVTFSQPVKAEDFKAGVTIQLNGKPVRISKATRRPGRTDVVDYIFKSQVRPDDAMTWSYESAQGFIQNLDGDHLLSVAPTTAM